MKLGPCHEQQLGKPSPLPLVFFFFLGALDWSGDMIRIILDLIYDAIRMSFMRSGSLNVHIRFNVT